MCTLWTHGKKEEQNKIVSKGDSLCSLYRLYGVVSFRLCVYVNMFLCVWNICTTHMCVKCCKNLNELFDYNPIHLCTLIVCVPSPCSYIHFFVWYVTNSVLIQFDFVFLHELHTSASALNWICGLSMNILTPIELSSKDTNDVLYWFLALFLSFSLSFPFHLKPFNFTPPSFSRHTEIKKKCARTKHE